LLTQGLLGDKVIEIRPGTAAGAALEEGDTLRSTRPVDLEELLRSASDALGNAVVLLSDFREIADALLRGEGTAGRILTDDDLYRSLLDASGAMSTFLRSFEGGGTLGLLARDSTLYVELRSVVAALDTVTQAIVEGRGTLGRLLWSDTLYARLVDTSLRADSILRRLESGEGTAGMLVQDPALYENLNKLAVDLQGVLEEFRAQPRRYLPPITIF
ncbi:MAG: MlaD family protein, partial [Gemmatimonadota bacterium]